MICPRMASAEMRLSTSHAALQTPSRLMAAPTQLSLKCRGSSTGDRVVAANQREAIVYSITSSASDIKLSESLSSSAFAAFRLITNSNLVGCVTGKSAGLAPLRIRPV
jgi:hypothetical protein